MGVGVGVHVCVFVYVYVYVCVCVCVHAWVVGCACIIQVCITRVMCKTYSRIV